MATRNVNGADIVMTAEEEAAFLAERVANPLPPPLSDANAIAAAIANERLLKALVKALADYSANPRAMTAIQWGALIKSKA